MGESHRLLTGDFRITHIGGTMIDIHQTQKGGQRERSDQEEYPGEQIVFWREKCGHWYYLGLRAIFPGRADRLLYGIKQVTNTPPTPENGYP